jgi:hypothetical protein
VQREINMNTVSSILKALAALGAVVAIAASAIAAIGSPQYATWLAIVAVFLVLASKEL